jgi:hypothetical protein
MSEVRGRRSAGPGPDIPDATYTNSNMLDKRKKHKAQEPNPGSENQIAKQVRDALVSQLTSAVKEEVAAQLADAIKEAVKPLELALAELKEKVGTGASAAEPRSVTEDMVKDWIKAGIHDATAQSTAPAVLPGGRGGFKDVSDIENSKQAMTALSV